MNTIVIKNWKELSEHIPVLEDLAESAAEPNVFYEHWMLIPAMKTLGQAADLRIILIFGPDPVRKTAPPILYGLIPLELTRDLYKVPIRNYSTWKHKYCFLCTPLLRKNYEREVLSEFFTWLNNHEGRRAIMEFKHISGEGPVYQALVDVMNLTAQSSYVWETFNRALFKPLDSSEKYLEAALSGRRRKELRRQQRLLSEKGAVTFSMTDSAEHLSKSLNDFLNLEASGWKGRAQTAFASTELDREFFEAFASAAYSRDRLMMLTMKLDEKPLA
ncbi:MAG TPA: GNAT family N-acetyltransferase, partial [Blastocatellia bacterium]|nr:GNAT family N-acetyltransferase [Blastocatellia bacterium]